MCSVGVSGSRGLKILFCTTHSAKQVTDPARESDPLSLASCSRNFCIIESLRMEKSSKSSLRSSSPHQPSTAKPTPNPHPRVPHNSPLSDPSRDGDPSSSAVGSLFQSLTNVLVWRDFCSFLGVLFVLRLVLCYQ